MAGSSLAPFISEWKCGDKASVMLPNLGTDRLCISVALWSYRADVWNLLDIICLSKASAEKSLHSEFNRKKN